MSNLLGVERRLMQLIAERGLGRFVGMVTLVSMALSQVITLSLMWATGQASAGYRPATISAAVVPGIVAPVMALMVGRLLQSLQRASEALDRLARTDPLTGVSNRREFAARAEQLWQARTGHRVLAMVDVDDFKRVNDSFGHPAGDRVLIALATGLAAAVQPWGVDAVVGRLGGDEFAVLVIVPEAEDTETALAALTAATDLQTACPGSRATIGQVTRFEDGVSLDEALSRADHALYSIKHRRNVARPADRGGTDRPDADVPEVPGAVRAPAQAATT